MIASLRLFVRTSITIPSLSSFLVALAALVLLNFLRLFLGPHIVVVRGRHIEVIDTTILGVMVGAPHVYLAILSDGGAFLCDLPFRGNKSSWSWHPDQRI